MTKSEFLRTLRNGLRSLPDADAERSLTYYIEMIDDRMDDGMTEEEAVAAVGDPAQLAREILRDSGPSSEPSGGAEENRDVIFCPRCSKAVTDGSRFCPRCGYSFEQEPNTVTGNLPEPEGGEPIEQISRSALEAGYDLKWYHFLIRFFIWFQAALNAVGLIMILADVTSGSFGSFFSPLNSGMRSWFYTLMITTVLFIVYLIFTRRALAGWKRYAPRLYLISLFFPFVSRLAAVIVSSVAYYWFGTSGFIPLTRDDLGVLVGGIVLFILNFIYFRKRAELFTE